MAQPCYIFPTYSIRDSGKKEDSGKQGSLGTEREGCGKRSQYRGREKGTSRLGCRDPQGREGVGQR